MVVSGADGRTEIPASSPGEEQYIPQCRKKEQAGNDDHADRLITQHRLYLGGFTSERLDEEEEYPPSIKQRNGKQVHGEKPDGQDGKEIERDR